MKYDNAEDYKKDWVAFAKDILGVRLTRKQRKILRAIQENRFVTIKSCHSYGKDFIAAVTALCFLSLHKPSKVIITSSTGRQVIGINMAEIAKIYRRTKIDLGFDLLTSQIKTGEEDWYLMAFKASDKAQEDWGGFHSPNIMIIVSEASSVEQMTFDAIRGLMTGGNAKLLLVGNAFGSVGPFYDSFSDPKYTKFTLSAFDSPNVRSGKILVPGQVDRLWVEDMIKDFCEPVSEENITDECFKWCGQWYKPDDVFSTKVLGQYATESEDQLIPLSWLEQSYERWEEMQKPNERLKLGVDVAGMGRDKTVFCYRYGNYVEKFESFFHQDHMETVGKIRNTSGVAYIDTIGEGAGVFSRLAELGHDCVSVKFGESAKGLTDITGQRTFADMVSYLCWSLRDALNPKYDINLALPRLDELTQDLTKTKWSTLSDGRIKIEPKDLTKKRLKRSPDFRDALINTFSPKDATFDIDALVGASEIR